MVQRQRHVIFMHCQQYAAAGVPLPGNDDSVYTRLASTFAIRCSSDLFKKVIFNKLCGLMDKALVSQSMHAYITTPRQMEIKQVLTPCTGDD